MKNLNLLFLMLMLASVQLKAQSTETIQIKTSAICEMCQYTIEKDMAFEKGVKSALLDLETKVLTVEYNAKKTNPETIRKRITMVGYDADSLKRDEKAHAKLAFCCQSDEHRVPLIKHEEGDE
ncbi:MAG: heavy-metal-associated domain-containing protein [Cyclobacteriaceae bacterium]